MAIRVAAERLVEVAPEVVPSLEQRRVFGQWVKQCRQGSLEVVA